MPRKMRCEYPGLPMPDLGYFWIRVATRLVASR
jgi:hypothetical protein